MHSRILLILLALVFLTSGFTMCDRSESPTLEFADGTLQLQVCTPDIIRVLYTKNRNANFFARKTLATAPKNCDNETFYQFHQGIEESILSTENLSVRVNMNTGNVSFYTIKGERLLTEKDRSLEAAEVQGESVYHIHQRWKSRDGEAFYGLGQHQQNLMNIKDYPINLIQYNTEIVVPMVVSSLGYGILWDNTSQTRWGDLQDFISLSNVDGSLVNEFTAEVSGDYIFQTYSSGRIELLVDGEKVIDHWRQGWLPGKDYAKVPMEAGHTYRLELKFESDLNVNIAKLSYKLPEIDPSTSLWSKVGDGIDYYFVHGSHMDDVVAGYRKLTGEAPMMPRWAYGLWQCRERYESADEVIEVLQGFRSRNIPLDNIVQDWRYWIPGTWGSHEFDAERFANPADWVRQIHEEYNARIMISVWPKFHVGTDNFNQLNDAGYIYQPNLKEGIKDFTGHFMSYFDAFNPDAREMFWSQVSSDLYRFGFDAWWMDATEPEVVEGPYPTPEVHQELYETHMHPTAMGSGSRMLNAFSLVNSQAVYEGQRKESPNQRVFILTRSAFAGQQRYASASWSGDITTTWTAFKKQIPAGLNFTISGIPYWTTDIGGFSEEPRISSDRKQWAELNNRWFQFGVFTPLLRVHGQDDRTGDREMWNFDDETYKTMLKFDRLRYRLLPYIYSLAGAVTHKGGTIMRPLVMDFPTDINVHDIGDQYMFGPAFLVNPVTDYGARERKVVLPITPGGWYNFWTGAPEAGGRTVVADAPYTSLPLFIRAGSIIPMGPNLQYTDESSWDPITLYVYTGADGSFTLYEDQGLNYNYEQGEFSEIPIIWDEDNRRLTFGTRRGYFPEMLQQHTFKVIFVSKSHPKGFSFEPDSTQTVIYRGDEIRLDL